MSLIEAIILGIVQGLTEFLPVSSSGHIELGKALLDIHASDPLLFSIIVHSATALSTVIIYFKDLQQIIHDALEFEWNEASQFLLMIAISMIPVTLVGIFYEKEIEILFEGQIALVGFMLLVTGGLLWFSSRLGGKEENLTFMKAFVIGIAQAIAILPGISRSGATISTALILGVDREKAARFSFLMVLPPILGATVVKINEYLDIRETSVVFQNASEGGIDAITLVAGFIASFIAGLLACKWMIKLVKRSKLDYFTIYCGIVGIIAIVAGFII